mgnify:CR=1 FL=1
MRVRNDTRAIEEGETAQDFCRSGSQDNGRNT